jgi:hypothetical protein
MFVNIIPYDDLRFNDTLTQSLDNQYLRVGHAFPRHQHMRKKGGYLFLSGFFPLYDAIHGWMTGRIDGRMESFTKNDHDVLYYM